MNEKGFTLIELLVAMGISAAVLMVILLSIYQVVWGTERSNDQVVALTDVNHAALWLRRDLQMSQDTGLIDGNPVPEDSVSLYWVDNTGWVSAELRNHSSNYTLSGTNLLRNYDGTESIVGRHITSAGFTRNGGVVTCNITATGSGILEREETLQFNIYTHMRPEGAE